MMDDIKNLHPLEVKVLLQYGEKDELFAEKLQRDLDYKEGHANQAFSWLSGKGFLQSLRKEHHVFFELTELGQAYHKDGLPENRIISLIKDKGAKTLPEIAAELKLENKDVGSAFGVLSKEGVLAMDGDKRASLANDVKIPRLELTAALIAKAAGADNFQLEENTLSHEEKSVIAGLAKKRGAADSPFKIIERDVAIYSITAEGLAAAKAVKEAGLTGNEIGALTPKMLETGQWKEGSFRSYNIGVAPARLMQGRTNAYVSFLEETKDKLVALGFEEFDGPLVETEFWNCDALFMPQFHAARDIHDAYKVKYPEHAKSIEEPFLTNVSQTHKNGGDTGSRGWNYEFNEEFTRRLLLRTQGTVLSAHQLHKAKVPGKYFGIVRCFRYDKVDATHLSDFYQTEGIVVGEDVNLKTLLGMLEIFATEIAGATDVKYVPGYFPFTEPSIEVHIKHPVLGWFELGGSGIFRPEVTRPMGITCPVAAWGIGIDRMALMKLGLNDLRELFSSDIEKVRFR